MVLSGIMAGAGLASSIFGGISSAKAAREQRKLLRAQKAEEDAWYKRRYNEDYADTAAGQRMLQKALDYAKLNNKRAEGAAAVAGGTDAAAAMAKEAGNKVVADTLADMAAADVARKDSIDAQHRQAKSHYDSQELAIKQAQANAVSQAASGAGNALISGAAAIAMANGTGSGSNLSGTSNNSTPVEVKSSPSVSTNNSGSSTTGVVNAGSKSAGVAPVDSLDSVDVTADDYDPFKYLK